MRKLAFLAILLEVYAKVRTIPPECDPHQILLDEQQRCREELEKHNATGSVDSGPGCPGMWDMLNCWPHAQLGETVSQPCPTFLHTKGEPGEIYRNCTSHGWTDSFPPHDIACENAFDTFSFPGETAETHLYFLYVKTMYTVGYAISLISLSIAISILCFFRKLHCTRNYIHIQLFLSFILRAAFIFIKDSVLFSTEDFYHCNSYPVSCKLVLLFSHYCIMANYSWLLVEGHYLHALIRVSFSKRLYFWCYMLLGWGAPSVVIVAWGLAKYLHEDEGCWETRKYDWIWWILRLPVLLFITINLLFFLSIIKILVGKLRKPDVHGNAFSQYKKLVKSTFLLVSLFGLHYILFAFLPDKVNDLTYKIWNFVELALSSTQGFVVAVLYCFLNGEVQHEFRRKWRRWKLRELHRGARQHHGSMSQSGAPLTQVSLFPRGPTACSSSSV
ncbi:secretin receptor-like isoform X2 [Scleropages formosus]|uniref:Secretin receptor n=1 Tax=Scleropages formosus TaxID=113540 RepID=A0A8C9VSZ9_SCLFO|nr:secretin receptor isoform X2 [Scleropages formosus]